VCRLFIFKDTELSPIQDSSTLRQSHGARPPQSNPEINAGNQNLKIQFITTMDEVKRARRLVQKLKTHHDIREYEQMLTLKDVATTQLSAALAHSTDVCRVH
jgi:hypothetical protein